MNINRIKAVLVVIIFALTILISIAYSQEKEESFHDEIEDIRCHKCKEKDLNLVFKHKQLGFDGCFKCHDDLLEKKPEEKVKK